MSTEIILIALSSIVILSYTFDLLARKFKMPSVILLLMSGIGLHAALSFFRIELPNFQPVLPVVGTLGLILIVLEGALELKLEYSKTKIIKTAFTSAGIVLLITSLCISAFLYYWTDNGFYQCFLNAIPFGVISSAIAIPSASVLPETRKDFIVYESSFSDILGIFLFNFILSHEMLTVNAFLQLGYQIILIIIIAGVFCLLLLYLLKHITHHLKFFLILAVLIFVYSIGKNYHLPTLLIVLAFGLFMNNLQWKRSPWFNRTFQYEGFSKDLHLLGQISGESAFIVRTFFFLIFGFYLDVDSLFQMEVWETGIIIFAIIFLVRIAYQKLLIKDISWTEILTSPRGLISILLFFSIPAEKRLDSVTDGLLFFIILTTSLIMTLALVASREKKL